MDTFTLSLKAKIPIIGVETDDLLNFEQTVHLSANRTVTPYMASQHVKFSDTVVYWTSNEADITTSIYRKVHAQESQLILVNSPKKNILVFDAGVMPTSEVLLNKYLFSVFLPDKVVAIKQVLLGYSLKKCGEFVQLTMARTGACSPEELKKTIHMVGAVPTGLEAQAPSNAPYFWPKQLDAWWQETHAFFANPEMPQFLAPRGLLLTGPPGTGKSMFAGQAARNWNVPLYRLDIPSLLSRWIGVAESRLASIFHTVDQAAPCVLLLDEVEKIFTVGGDDGTVQRLLSQLLWWLENHKSQVFVVMTTNDKSAVPPELYRPGRIDEVVDCTRLTNVTQKVEFLEWWLLHSNANLGMYAANLQSLVEPTKGQSYADLVQLGKNVLKQIYSLDKSKAGA